MMQDVLRQQLVGLFGEYSAQTVSSLIPDIVVAWGWERASRETLLSGDDPSTYNRLDKAREIAFRFINTLDKVVLHDSGPRLKDSHKALSLEERELIAQKWATELANLPIEETIQTFVSSVAQWLLTCDIDRIGDLRQTDAETLQRLKVSPEKDKMNDVIWKWGNSLAVY